MQKYNFFLNNCNPIYFAVRHPRVLRILYTSVPICLYPILPLSTYAFSSYFAFPLDADFCLLLQYYAL